MKYLFIYAIFFGLSVVKIDAYRFARLHGQTLSITNVHAPSQKTVFFSSKEKAKELI